MKTICHHSEPMHGDYLSKRTYDRTQRVMRETFFLRIDSHRNTRSADLQRRIAPKTSNEKSLGHENRNPGIHDRVTANACDRLTSNNCPRNLQRLHPLPELLRHDESSNRYSHSQILRNRRIVSLGILQYAGCSTGHNGSHR